MTSLSQGRINGLAPRRHWISFSRYIALECATRHHANLVAPVTVDETK
jgi:hypothetical protein